MIRSTSTTRRTFTAGRHALLLLCTATLLGNAACSHARSTAATGDESPETEATARGEVEIVETTLTKVGLDPTALDRDADPCQDFYRFACGGWLDRTEIPADRTRWSRGFTVVAERNEAVLKEILEEAAARVNDPEVEPDPVFDPIGRFYSACMNEEAIEAAGVAPIEPLVAAVRKVRKPDQVGDAVIELHRYGVWPLFDISSAQDFKEATQVIAYLDQGGLGLPDRDFYLTDDERSENIRKEYVAHVERMMKLGGLSEAQARKAAKDVFSVEKQLAEVSKTRVERRNPHAIYNKRSREQLRENAPGFPWDRYFAAMGLEDLDELVLTSVEFFDGMNRILPKTSPEAWRHYLHWHVLRSTAPTLSKAFVDESFRMAQVLGGQQEIEPRWKRCIASTDAWLGELLAQPWVDRQFGADSKAATERMVFEISDAFGRNLQTIEWMDDTTRERAHEKRKAMAYQIGYPNRWRTYDFDVRADTYAANVLAGRAFELQRDLGKIGKPVDRDEWHMTPPTVNAYYSPLLNQMVFPAGILQPPFYNPNANVAVNLGGMGMVVGHELTHGFDDQGSQFAADGNLRDWWEPEVGERFRERTQCVADQYASYEPLPGVKLNGDLTKGENIADIGGVKMAFQAYRAMRADAPERVVADGFTEDQQFFISMGQSWCTKTRDETVRMLAQVAPHSPPEFRVNGSLANVPQFAEAFGCEEGTPMNPPNRCEVW